MRGPKERERKVTQVGVEDNRRELLDKERWRRSIGEDAA